MADVVVVGGGLSGLEVASELLAAGVRDVVVLEGGPDRVAVPGTRGQATPNGFERPTDLDSPLDRPWTSATPPHYGGSVTPWGVGGRSLFWHGVVLRLEAWALEDACWPQPIRSALLGTGSDCPGLYTRLEAELREWATAAPLAAHDEADAAFVGLLSGTLAGPVQAVPQAVRRWRSGGHERWRAYTPLDRWREHGGLVGSNQMPTIVPESAAVELLVSQGSSPGVRVINLAQRDRVTVACSIVVLAAGAIENTRLVAQLTHPGAREWVRYVGLNDHLVQGFVVRVPARRLPPAVRFGAYALVARDRERRCNVFARLHPSRPADQTMLLDVWAMGEQRRSSANEVVFPERQSAPWRALVRPGLSHSDEAVLRGERNLLTDLWHHLADLLGVAATPLRFPRFLQAPRPFQVARRQAVRQRSAAPVTYTWPLGASDHEGGTLPFGELIDDSGQLRAVPGVFVVGPATFPRAGAANPSLTTLALARRTARCIAAG